MKKKGQGKRRCIFAVFLCLCVLFTTQSEIWNRFSVFAAEESDTKVVLSFAELSEEIKEQTVPVGTVYEELELPEELNVFMKQTEISSTPGLAEEKSEEETVSGNDPETGGEAEDSDTETGDGQESAVSQETHTVTMQEYFAENVIPIQTLENTQTEKQEETVTIDGVTWQSEPEYDGSAEGTYTFTAVLPDGYALADGVSLPQITVTVENGTDAVIQALHDRIAALPDAEEYLASEPDMEDEDAYAEWEEKLYEYVEEALAIWEEYGALTEEQQTQMREGELEKLDAWMEIAETLKESSQVMAADNGSHKHCVCGGNINIGDHTSHTEDIVYDNILTSDNGQLLVNGAVQSDYTLTSGSYYLADDVALNSELVIVENSTVYICLNNHTLSYDRSNGKHRVIMVGEKATLNLCTCGNSGVITGGDADSSSYGGGLYLSGNSIFNMYGGSIEGNVTSGSGGGIFSGQYAACNLYEVNICRNTGLNGAGILLSHILNIYGGEIKNNDATGYGGGIAGTAESCILQDVKICNNTAAYAAGLYWANGNLIMSDVEISNNIVSDSTARYPAGGVALMQGTIGISGTIIITGNQYNEKQNNFWNYCNPSTARPSKLVIVDDLDEQSVIGLTNKTTPNEAAPDPVEVASGSNHMITDADWSRFFSDEERYKIVKDGNALFLALPDTCDLSGLDLTAEGAKLEPNFQADITTYTATVGNDVEKVGITATLAGTTDGKTIKIKNGTDLPETDMTSGKKKEVPLAVGLNTIEITVTSGSETKTYTIEITREAPAGNPVTITSYKDGVEWTGAGAPSDSDYKLTSDGGNTFLPGLAAPDGTYKIYSGDTDTGVEVTVTGAEVTARVDYYTVTFYDGSTALTTPAQQIVLKNQTASAPATDPTKTGYTFGKWVTADGGSTTYDFTKAVTGKTSVYASWTPVSYSITYILDGGTATGNPAGYTIESSAITLKNPTRTGYSFTGWSGTGLDGENNMAVTIAAGSTGNREYTAHWSAADYAVTLHTNGGESGTDLTSYTYGTGAALPTDWTKTGYTFDGWYDNERFTGTAVTDISGTDTGDKEYWAKWTANTYQATFDYHGADGGNTTQSKTVTYDSTYGALPVPARTGYTFKGWYTEENGQGSKVDAGTTVTTTSAHTLHAYWKDETAPDQPVLQDGVTLPTGWTNAQDTIPLKLYDGVGVVKLLVSVDGNPYAEVSGFSGGTGSVNYNYAVLDGEHTYQFKAVDAADNVSEESAVFTVKLDQTKPVIGTITYENKAANLWQWIIGKTSMIVHVPVTDTGSGVTKISYTLTPRDAAGNPDSSNAVEKTAAVKDGEAKLTFDADFRGTITINCTDAAGNKADGVIIGKDAGGVIVEDHAPDITTDARTDYYDTPTAVNVTVKDDTNNAVTAGIASVTYQVGDGTAKSVTVDTSALQAQVTFTIPASEISTGTTEIKITAEDHAGNEAAKSITIKVKGPEKQPAAEIDYREEELTGIVPDGIYSIDGTEYTADQQGHIPIIEGWFGNTVSIIKKGNGNETTDSPAQSLPIPARPAASDAPELRVRDDKSITLKIITGAQYRLADGTGNWQDSTAFTGLAQKTIYKFKAYYPATDTSFASPESGETQIATMPTAPTPDKLKIGYVAETLTLTDGIEAFTDQNCQTPVNGNDVTVYMGQTLYIRYPVNGIIPASLTTAVSILARPAKPVPGQADASYPGAKDGAITGLTSGTAYEYRLKDQDGNFGVWQDASLDGTRIGNLPAGEYEVRVKAVETGNVSFRSEAAAVTIGEKPATKYETPNIRIDYSAEALTGFAPGAEYTINGKTVTAGADGTINIETDWFGATLSIVRKGNGKDKLDSDAQSLPVPARPAKPTPTGVDVSTAGGTGKLTGLTADTTYEVSTDGGKTWVSHTADGNGEITGLAPGTYVVCVKAGTSNFVSEPSDSVKIGAFQIKVTFMVDGAKYKEISVDYGTALTDIPPVPAKENAIGAWCMDEQGTTPAEFTNISADMTVYAVYTTAYTVTLQGGTGYTLSAEAGSTSPVKEGGSFTFRFALREGYKKGPNFAVKVSGANVELTANDTYTITDIRGNQTVMVEGVVKTDGGSSNPPGGGDNDDDDDGSEPAPTPTPQPTQPPTDTPPTTPTTPPGTTPPVAENESEGRKPETTPEPEETHGPEEPESNETQPSSEPSQPQIPDTSPGSLTYSVGKGAVIVTLNNVDETVCTARVADAATVAHAVLSEEEFAEAEQGQIIEIRIDVERLENVPEDDAGVIEGGIKDCQEQIPGLVMGMYVDISMYMRIGSGDWNAIHATNEPVEIILDVPDELVGLTADFYIMRAHEGEYLLMEDMDEAPETITIQTEAFSTYAILYQMREGAGEKLAAKCSLCHICPTFLGICYFIWLAIIIALALVIYLIIRRKRKGEKSEEQ